MINWFMITALFVTSVMKKSVKIKCVFIVICLASSEVLLTKSAKYNTKLIPVVFYNLSGYGSHSFLKTLGNSEEDIFCIPNNEENYIFSRNRSSLTNLLFSKESGKCKTRVKIYPQPEIYGFKS